MSSLCLLFLLLIFSFTPTHSFHHDRLSLLAFKNLITSDPHHSMADWSPTNPFCNWTGVTCGRRHPNRAVSLNLTTMDLRGSISPSLGNLSFLRTLDLSGNALTGHIPTQLGRLFRLRELWLDNNGLRGNIPSQLGSCRNLTFLNINLNELTEYGLGETMSTKGDIYSYGILLLEMITRKRPTSDMFSGDLNLHKWVNLAFPNRVKEVIDYKLFIELDGDEFEENNVYTCLLSLLRVGLLCSKDSPEERPTMRDVVKVLESLKNNLGENAVASTRLRQSMSNLLSNTNATRNDAHASNADNSSTF